MAFGQKHYTSAESYFRQASDLNCSEGQFQLGYMYEKQLAPGVKNNIEEALKYYGLATDQDHPQAWIYKGNLHKLKHEYSKAKHCYFAAAKKGVAAAQYNIGMLYWKGTGVKQSYTKAAMYFEHKLCQDFAPALNNLGIRFLEGLEVEKNYDKAASYFKQPACEKYPLALFNQGYIHQERQELSTAVEYYRKAAGLGYQKAQDMLIHILHLFAPLLEETLTLSVEIVPMNKKVVAFDIGNDFNPLPGGRFIKDGPASGEELRDRYLSRLFAGNDNVIISLDNAMGYGSVFLEEVFGGLVRNKIVGKQELLKKLILKTEQESIRQSITRYIEDAHD